MKTIELTDEAYTELLELKNHISVKVREVTNKEILNSLKDGEAMPKKFSPRKYNYEPEYTFSECLDDVCKMIWYEQQSGNVAYIT
jgi:hypothetical protein